jgi:hypothetical protein
MVELSLSESRQIRVVMNAFHAYTLGRAEADESANEEVMVCSSHLCSIRVFSS